MAEYRWQQGKKLITKAKRKRSENKERTIVSQTKAMKAKHKVLPTNYVHKTPN
jgi:hypothetical protein